MLQLRGVRPPGPGPQAADRGSPHRSRLPYTATNVDESLLPVLHGFLRADGCCGQCFSIPKSVLALLGQLEPGSSVNMSPWWGSALP